MYFAPTAELDGLGLLRITASPQSKSESFAVVKKAREAIARKGGTLNDIVDNDPAVDAARMAVENRLQALDQYLSTPIGTEKRSIGRCGRSSSGCFRDFPVYPLFNERWGRWQKGNGQPYLDRIEDSIKRFQDIRKRVLDRMSNPIPYKGHVIKPAVVGNDLRYTVSFNISGKTGSFRSAEEAKAAVDNEVALGPGGLKAKEEFDAAAKVVGEAKAAEIIASKKQADKQTTTATETAPVPTKKGMSTAAKLGIAAAAVGGAFLLTR